MTEDDDVPEDATDDDTEGAGDDAESGRSDITIMDIPAAELHQRVDLAEVLIGTLQEFFARGSSEARSIEEGPEQPGGQPDPVDAFEAAAEVREVGGMMLIEPQADPQITSAIEKTVEGIQKLLPGMINLAMDRSRREEVATWRGQMAEAREMLDEWDESGGPPDDEDAPTPEQVAEMRREVEHAEAMLRGYDLLVDHFSQIEKMRNQILARMAERARRALLGKSGN